jgi:NDP-sugar pyrophosphorylase family protein
MWNKVGVMNKNLRAMVLAAGIGSRLAPLSDNLPKPLIRIGGKVIMEHILLLLKKHGISNVISNTYHLAEQIHDHFKNIKETDSINLEFVHEEKLSGVAGGIRECQDFLKQGTACIIMGDALTDIDLSALYAEHKKAVEENNCLATIAMMQVEDTSQFGVVVTKSMLDTQDKSNSRNQIIQFQEKPAAADALSNWANTGVYFFEPEIYDYIPSKEEAAKYDVAGDLFPKLLEEKKYIQAIPVKANTYWADLGTKDQYLQSVQDIFENKIKLDSINIDTEALSIPSSSIIKGYCDIANNVEIGENVQIENCVIYPNTKIANGVSLKNCIIGENMQITENTSQCDKIMAKSSNKCLK